MLDDIEPILSWKITPYGVQTYESDHVGEWLVVQMNCPFCKHPLVITVPLGAVGFECPHCFYYDLTYQWKE
jgi:transposase-like protein